MADTASPDKLTDLRVECYAGYQAEETPRRFWLGHRRVEVCEVLDRWLAPDHRYFKVRGDDHGTYILRYDPHSDRWQLTLYRSEHATVAFGRHDAAAT